MKRFIIFTLLLFAMAIDVSAQELTGFQTTSNEMPVYSDAMIVGAEQATENYKTDKHQLSYSQVNCDRCHDSSGGDTDNSFVYSDTGTAGLVAMRLPHYRQQF